MSGIDRMDRDTADNIIRSIKDQIAPLCDKLGLVLNRTKGKYDPNTLGLTVTLSFGVCAMDGTNLTEQADFVRHARLFGLHPGDYKREFTQNPLISGGYSYSVVGFNPRSGKYPVRTRRSDGKPFKHSLDLVKRALNLVRCANCGRALKECDDDKTGGCGLACRAMASVGDDELRGRR